jgi:transcription elongation factor Elf1
MIRVACSHCGKTHEFKVRDVFTKASISSEHLNLLHEDRKQ